MNPPRTVVTIGNFDGVHLGHAALVRRARAIADAAGRSTRVVVMSFDPHPLTVLRPGAAPARLTTFERRCVLLGALGADECIRLEPTGALLGESAEEFITRVATELKPVAVVEGPDFRFGRGRAGDVAFLREAGKKLGFTMEVVSPPVEVVLDDHTVITASSTMARWLIERGRVRDAAAVFGRAYEMTGTVRQGDRRGRTIGFPTANLDAPCLAPADGVYAGLAHLPEGRAVPAAISVGTKPTFGEHARTVEAYLLRDDGSKAWTPIPGLPEYGWPLRLEFRHWLRDQLAFAGLGPLLDQMTKDIARTRELCTEEPACR
jgi:riboflavin kinase/FMN adenylyltransferase